MNHNTLAVTDTEPTAAQAQTATGGSIAPHHTALTPYCHALRGATVVPTNTADAIYAATRELLTQMAAQNDLAPDTIASAFFTLTPDLDAAFPAKAARQLGWQHVALLCATEIPVPGALGSCVRVLLHFNATRPRSAYRSVYIHGAEKLLED